ncbi:S1/P1 nuclease [Allomuricauda sp. SCSIO 65647]|uniref:S1/P1 nuclease n=1 Tax=Allomuricauda sp. SCSIO 65647 TaxID=2908843 RepID=UPI001F1C140D|nr:S1/P1 nuclease [Muricauda sp. SCSIO 65647]UJH68028.1 S1/P1 nuclease [Muricauda sp. SCSIO 65647]
MRILVVLFCFSVNLVLANDEIWSKTGHRAIAEIAQQHLTKKAEKTITQLLGGHDLAFVSNFADEIKADRNFSKFNAWHYVNYPTDKKYTEVEPNPYGDVVMGIQKCIEMVSDEGSTKEDKVFYLKMLIHFVGDLHQPMHVGRLEDRGGNDLQVRWFDEGTNLHRLWDKNLIDSYGMSYTELAQTMPKLSKGEIKQIQRGTVYDWVEESQDLANELYDSVEVGEKHGYQYSYKYNKLMIKQLHVGGLRLAKVLNELFD